MPFNNIERDDLFLSIYLFTYLSISHAIDIYITYIMCLSSIYLSIYLSICFCWNVAALQKLTNFTIIWDKCLNIIRKDELLQRNNVRPHTILLLVVHSAQQLTNNELAYRIWSITGLINNNDNLVTLDAIC